MAARMDLSPTSKAAGYITSIFLRYLRNWRQPNENRNMPFGQSRLGRTKESPITGVRTFLWR